MPLNATFIGYSGLFISIACWALYSIMLAKKTFFLTFFGVISLLRIPTIITSIYLKTESRVLLYTTLVSCILFFLLHQEGYIAAPYAIYWLIPFITSYLFKDILYVKFLQATLLQHAIGSVIFLYKTNMDASNWLTLIPLVGLERFLFASGMFFVYHALGYIWNLDIYKQFFTKNNRNKNKIIHI